MMSADYSGGDGAGANLQIKQHAPDCGKGRGAIHFFSTISTTIIQGGRKKNEGIYKNTKMNRLTGRSRE